MMDCARAELTECPWLVPVRTAAEARRAAAEGKRFTFLVVEGMEPVGDRLERIDQYAAWGVRLGMLTWNEENQLACGAGGDPQQGAHGQAGSTTWTALWPDRAWTIQADDGPEGPGVNDASVVLLLQVDGVSVIAPGDLEDAGQARLAEVDPACGEA